MEVISVIIPVYNVGPYLAKCIDSIMKQSYKHLEIILIDDGSTDDCPKICDEYAKIDNRIKVIHKRNGGLSDARNVGLGLATGEYVTFVDSDDYLHQRMLAELYKNMKENHCDISTCKYTIVPESITHKAQPLSENISLVLTGEQALEEMLNLKSVTHSAWGKLYKIELFNDVRYPVGHNYEDLATTYILFSKSKNVVINSFRGYYYLRRSDSIMNSKFNTNRIDALVFAQQQLDYIIIHNPRIIKAAQYRLYIEAVLILVAMYESNSTYEDIKSQCMAVIRKYRWRVLVGSGTNTKRMVYASLSILSIGILIRIISKRSKTIRQMA